MDGDTVTDIIDTFLGKAQCLKEGPGIRMLREIQSGIKLLFEEIFVLVISSRSISHSVLSDKAILFEAFVFTEIPEAQLLHDVLAPCVFDQ